MSGKKTVWFSVLRNVVPADYEVWLERLAREGWNVERISQLSFIRMTFRKTEPRQYRCIFDLNAFQKEDYRSIYEQFGWEYVGAWPAVLSGGRNTRASARNPLPIRKALENGTGGCSSRWRPALPPFPFPASSCLRRSAYAFLARQARKGLAAWCGNAAFRGRFRISRLGRV